ncbi:hypothetical protein ACTMTJ_35370 [Phytohabitans sp. LJ34]|uniref:hypothetical protein n=1 Tax=Phytohabitans sp. LJ34 TaxID=3452217 RepID=UPI003F890EE0
MRFLPLLTLAAVLAAAGCSDVRAVNESRDDRREFPFTGERLVVDSGGADLRLVAGDDGAVDVERSLTGKATVDGNASWALDGDTLRLRVECSGFVPDCGGRHIVHVPGGVAVEVRSDAPVRAVGLGGDLTATVRDSWLRVEDPAGSLRLQAAFDVDVTGARSAEVVARSTDRDVSLAFAGPPSRVDARGAGAVEVTLPDGPETYRVSASPKGDAMRGDPASGRVVTAVAGDGHAARVRKGA